MPFKSKVQRRKMYRMADMGMIPHSMVAEFEEKTKGKSLPERVKRRKRKGSE